MIFGVEGFRSPDRDAIVSVREGFVNSSRAASSRPRRIVVTALIPRELSITSAPPSETDYHFARSCVLKLRRIPRLFIPLSRRLCADARDIFTHKGTSWERPRTSKRSLPKSLRRPLLVSPLFNFPQSIRSARREAGRGRGPFENHRDKTSCRRQRTARRFSTYLLFDAKSPSFRGPEV